MALNQDKLKSSILDVFNSEPTSKDIAINKFTNALMGYLLDAEVNLAGLTLIHPVSGLAILAQDAPLLFPDETGSLIKAALTTDINAGIPGWPATAVSIAAQLATSVSTKPIAPVEPINEPPASLPTLVAPMVTILAIPPVIAEAHKVGMGGGSKENVASTMASVIHSSVATTTITGAASNSLGFLLPVTGPRSIK